MHDAAARLLRELTANFRRCPNKINYYNLTTYEYAYCMQACGSTVVSSAGLPNGIFHCQVT